eukprot:351179-Chlamydomonas_euryale.AAC.2
MGGGILDKTHGLLALHCQAATANPRMSCSRSTSICRPPPPPLELQSGQCTAPAQQPPSVTGRCPSRARQPARRTPRGLAPPVSPAPPPATPCERFRAAGRARREGRCRSACAWPPPRLLRPTRRTRRTGR